MELTGRGGVVGDTGEYWRAISDLGGQYHESADHGDIDRDDAGRGENTGSAEGEQLGDDLEVVRGLGEEVLGAMAQKEPEIEGQLSEEEKQARVEFDRWQAEMAGTPEEYWHRLEEKWWVEKQIAMDYYATPKMDVLQKKAQGFLKKQVPELSDVGVQARAEMATKVALQTLAEKEIEMLMGAKLGRDGERKLKKGWDATLLHQAYGVMQDDLVRLYGKDTEGERPSGDEMNEMELAAWWVASEPENVHAKREWERLKAVEAAESEAEDENKDDGKDGAKDEEKVPLVHLSQDEAEIVSAPEMPVNTAMMGAEMGATKEAAGRENLVQKILRGLANGGFAQRADRAVATAMAAMNAAGTELVPVAEAVMGRSSDKGADKPEVGMEGAEQEEMIEQIITMTSQAVRMFEEQVEVLEDYNPLKSEMIQALNTLREELRDLKIMYEANVASFEEGKRQRDAGLSLDRTDVGESDEWRNGEISLERLYANGMLKRGESAELNLGVLRGLREKLHEELDRVTQQLMTERANYKDYLITLSNAERYLERLAEEEAEEKRRQQDDYVTDYPTDEPMRGEAES